MKRKIFSAIFLILGVVITLGAYGHGFVGRLPVDAELDKFPIAPAVREIIYFVWFFVSGCMVVFGAALIWAWLRFRNGDPSLLRVGYLIGALYLAAGVGGIIYRHGDSFMWVFIIEGTSLGVSTFVLRNAALGIPSTGTNDRPTAPAKN